MENLNLQGFFYFKDLKGLYVRFRVCVWTWFSTWRWMSWQLEANSANKVNSATTATALTEPTMLIRGWVLCFCANAVRK